MATISRHAIASSKRASSAPLRRKCRSQLRLCIATSALFLCALFAFADAVPVASSKAPLAIHRRRTCAVETLARTAFSDVADAATFFDRPQNASSDSPEATIVWTREDTCGGGVANESCLSGQNVALAGGKLSLAAPPSASGRGARANANVKAAPPAWNETARLRIHASFSLDSTSTNHSSVATIALALPHLNASISLSVVAAPVPLLWLASASHNLSVELAPPCADNAGNFHVVDLEWTPTRWLRWHWDGHLLHEMRLPDGDDGEQTPPGAADDEPVRVELSVASAALHVKTLEIQRVVGGQDDAVCQPHVLAPAANCRRHTHLEPRLGDDQGYLSLAQVYAFLHDVPSRFPPLLTKLEPLGVSTQNRSLLALCVGACTVVDAPQALFTGMHHSREPISMMNLVYTIDLLALDFANGELDMVALLAARQLWFVLVVNPDGYARNEELEMWTSQRTGQRKNARAGCAKSPADNGVDLNRNYDVCFSQDNEGSSTNPCGEDYRGPAPFSEPETLAIKRLVEQRASHFAVSLNYHSFGRYFNVPFACKALDTPRGQNLSVFESWAKEMTRYNGFAYGQPWKDDNLYSVNGETSDWLWATHGIFSMSPEVGPSFNAHADRGFWPAREDVPALAAELHYSNIVAARLAGPLYDVVVRNVTREPAAEAGAGPAALLVVAMEVQNQGLGLAGDVEIVLTTAVDGDSSTLSFTTAANVSAAQLGTIRDEARSSVVRFLAIPEATVLHLLVRDALSCQYTRLTIAASVSPRSTRVAFQQWHALELPPCGVCRTVGRDADQLPAASSLCATVGDLMGPHRFSMAGATTAHTTLKDADAETRDAKPTASPAPLATEPRSPEPVTTELASTAPLTQVPATEPAPTATESLNPQATTAPPPPSATPSLGADDESELSSSTTTASAAGFGLDSLASVPVLATLALVGALAAFVVVRRRRRDTQRSLKPTAKSSAAKSTQRKKYVKVVNDEEEADEQEAEQEEAGEDAAAAARSPRHHDSDDDDEAEFGRRRHLNATRPRGPSADDEVM